MFLEVSTEQQIEIVESLAREIWTEHYSAIIGLKQVEYMLDKFQSKQAILDQIKAGVLYFLMKEDKEFIGYIAVQPKGAELFLSKLYVRSSRRNEGHGKKAVRFAESLALKKNCEKSCSR